MLADDEIVARESREAHAAGLKAPNRSACALTVPPRSLSAIMPPSRSPEPALHEGDDKIVPLTGSGKGAKGAGIQVVKT